jgi:glycosyltransferase involved in cell wall biosynthesis
MEAIDSHAAGEGTSGQAEQASFAAEAGGRPLRGRGIRAVGVALGHVKRLVPRPLRPRLSRGGDQYEPRPLSVPASYLRTQPPDPAPTISIVTPAGRDTPYLERTLESVIGQGYPRLEYIVVHHGSNSGASQILNRHRPRLRCVESRPDRGQANAINAGFDLSRGEIMAWVNSDDVLLPGALSHVSRYFVAHPDVDVVYGHRVLLDESDRDIGLWVTPRHCADSLRWLDWIPQETVFWRRRVWDSVGGIDESLALAFDWDLFSRFHRSGASIVRLPRFLGGFRKHPAQKTRVYHEEALVERAKVQERWHGKPITPNELRARIFPYLLRSLPYFAWYGARARLPARRVEVSSAWEMTDTDSRSEMPWSA